MVWNAARGYFDKSVSELTLAEQAFIAAIPNNPTRYNPLTNYDNTVQRKNLILQQLYEADDIGSLDRYMAETEEVVLNPHQTEEINNSVVTYARHCATESLMSVSALPSVIISVRKTIIMHMKLRMIHFTICVSRSF